jgi:PAS domain S-box-containing protein
VKSWAAAGTTEAFARLVEPLERGEMPHCIGTALADPLVPLRRLDTDVCRDAPDDGPAARGFAVIGLPLCCDGRTFGVMVASIPAAAAGDPEAEGLLIEAAGDIGFAMRGFELVAQATAAAKFLQVGMNRLETIIRSSPAAIYSFDSEGRVLSWNPAAERIFGWPTNEVVGCKIPIVPSDRWAEHLSRTERVFSGEEVPSIVTECVRRDGSRVPVGVSAAPLREVDGTVVGILGMGWDLSDLRMAELDLRRSEERYRDLVENLEDIVYAIDTEGRFRFIGSAVTRYGYSMEDLAGRPFSEFLHPDDLPAIGEAFARALAGETAPVECRALDKAGGVRNFRISARPTVEDGRPVGFSGVIVDVTDQKQMEARLAGQTQEILESQVVTIQALARLAESRDDDTGHHIERVRTFARVLAETMRESRGGDDELSDAFVQNLFHGAPLHDVGKVGIPDAVLLKPGKLTPDEFGLIKTHTTLGADTLAAVHQRYPKNEFLRMGMDIARSHHEKWDGSGYPDGLRGADIPLAARIVAVADVYDALRARRPYKEPFPHEKACAIIIEGGGKHFDPEVIVAFRTVEARFAEIRAKLED